MKKNKIRLTESQLHNIIKDSVKKVLREGKNVNPKVQQKIKELMSQVNNSNTMYEILEETPADGLTIWEAMEVFHALEKLWYDSDNFLDNGQGFVNVTPYQYNKI